MPMTIALVAFALLLLAVSAQWRRGRWLGSGRWVLRSAGPHVLIALPVAALFLASLGLSFRYPVAVVPAIGFSSLLLWMMVRSSRSSVRATVLRLPRGLRPAGMIAGRAPVPQRPHRTSLAVAAISNGVRSLRSAGARLRAGLTPAPIADDEPAPQPRAADQDGDRDKDEQLVASQPRADDEDQDQRVASQPRAAGATR